MIRGLVSLCGIGVEGADAAGAGGVLLPTSADPARTLGALWRADGTTFRKRRHATDRAGKDGIIVWRAPSSGACLVLVAVSAGQRAGAMVSRRGWAERRARGAEIMIVALARKAADAALWRFAKDWRHSGRTTMKSA